MNFFKITQLLWAFSTLLLATSVLHAQTADSIKWEPHDYWGTDYTALSPVATTKIDSSSMNIGAIITWEELLRGRVAGLQSGNLNGTPGAGAYLNLRGQGSLYQVAPLIVLNGLPLPQGELSSTGGGSIDPLAFINPSDIASIVVLKDASAVGMYGNRGMNGVILINTKKSTLPSFSYSNFFSVGSVQRQPSVLSGQDFRTYIQQEYSQRPDVLAQLGNANTNWQDEIYRSAFGQNHYVNASGVKKWLPYRISAGYTQQQGALLTSNMQRMTTQLAVSPQFFDKQLKVEFNLRKTWLLNNVANIDAASAAAFADPTQPIRTASGAYYARNNPVAMLEQMDAREKNGQWGGLLHLAYAPNALKGFSVHTRLSRNSTHINYQHTIDPSAIWKDPAQPYQLAFDRKLAFRMFELYADYAKELPSIKSSIQATIGGNVQSNLYHVTYNRFVGEDNTAYAAYYARVSYHFQKSFSLLLTWQGDRNTDNATYKPSHQGANSPSVAVSWQVLEQAGIFSSFKLRASYGAVGLQSRPTPPPSGSISGVPDILRPSMKMANIGADFTIAKRADVSINAYRRLNEYGFHPVYPPPGTNDNFILKSNGLSVENRGIEWQINARVIDNERTKWRVGINGAFNHNEMKHSAWSADTIFNELARFGQVPYIASVVGNSLNNFATFNQVYDASGKPLPGVYEDKNRDGVINQLDVQISGPVVPKYTMGINMSLSHKNWEASFSARSMLGQYTHNILEEQATYSAFVPGHLYNKTEGYIALGDRAPLPRSSYYVQKSSFTRLDYISIGYHLRKATQGKRGHYVYVSGQNLLLFSPYKGTDPERWNGIDATTNVPRMSSLAVGFRMSM